MDQSTFNSTPTHFKVMSNKNRLQTEVIIIQFVPQNGIKQGCTVLFAFFNQVEMIDHMHSFTLYKNIQMGMNLFL